MNSRIHMEPLNAPFVSSLTPEQVHQVKVVQLIIRDYVQVASWGIIKMNDYLVSGTRQQYWEEFFVKHVMSVSLVSSYKLGSNPGHITDISEGNLYSTVGIILISLGREILGPHFSVVIKRNFDHNIGLL